MVYVHGMWCVCGLHVYCYSVPCEHYCTRLRVEIHVLAEGRKALNMFSFNVS